MINIIIILIVMKWLSAVVGVSSLWRTSPTTYKHQQRQKSCSIHF